MLLLHKYRRIFLRERRARITYKRVGRLRLLLQLSDSLEKLLLLAGESSSFFEQEGVRARCDLHRPFSHFLLSKLLGQRFNRYCSAMTLDLDLACLLKPTLETLLVLNQVANLVKDTLGALTT